MARKKEIKISIVMVDGGFRENVFGAQYFSQQDFPHEQYEVIWVDYYNTINKEVELNSRVRSITLNKTGIYHSSYCFNRGISDARGEVVVIVDGDQIVPPDFLQRVWECHKYLDKLVVYGYRYDEIRNGSLQSFDLQELKTKCVLKNAFNYGSCLTVRKKWLIEMNGYELHQIFQSGFHANGLYMYSRFKNMGMAIQWEPSLRLYHPWHPHTLATAWEYNPQHKIIQWVQDNLYWKAISGIDSSKNIQPPTGLQSILDQEMLRLNEGKIKQRSEPAEMALSEGATRSLSRFFGNALRWAGLSR